MVVSHEKDAIICRLYVLMYFAFLTVDRPNGRQIPVRTRLEVPHRLQTFPVESIVCLKHAGLDSNNGPAIPRVLGKTYETTDWASMTDYSTYPYSISVGGNRSHPRCKTCKKPFEGTCNLATSLIL